MVTRRINFLATTEQPNPDELIYWVDMSDNPYYGSIKYYDGHEWTNLIDNEVDLTHYVTELRLQDHLASKLDRIEMTNYYRKVDVDQLLDDKIGQDDLNEYSVYFTGKLSDYALKSELADYALEMKIDSAKYALKTDLHNYVLKSELPDIVIPGTGDGYKHQFLEETAYNQLQEYKQDTIYMVYEPITWITVDKPINTTFTYDGLVHSLFTTDAYTVFGTGGSQVGTYTFTVRLNYGYKWTDGSLNNVVVVYTINEDTSDWVFGDTFPIRFSEEQTNWVFGDIFPIRFI